MKGLVILLLVAIIVFLLWNDRSRYAAPPMASDGGDAPVPADVIQAIIEKVQQTKPDEYPLETLFVNAQADGSYTSRFMFYNTRKFLGAQYDVVSKVLSDGNVEIVNISQSAKVDSEAGYKPDTYKPFEDITKNTTNQLKAVIATRPETAEETKMRLGTRS